MEFEENKDNIIEKANLPEEAEEVVSAAEETEMDAPDSAEAEEKGAEVAEAAESADEEPEEEPVEAVEEAQAETAEEEIAETAKDIPTEAVETEPAEATEEEAPPVEEPKVEKPVKKGRASLVVKIIGLVLLLLLIFVPASYSLIKGDAFQKELIAQKKSLSRTYESVYRKQVFPKLSQMFIPKWAKQQNKKTELVPQPQTQPQGSASVDPSAHLPESDKPKDILDGVPQVPEGMEYYPLYIEDHMIVYGRDDWLFTAGDGGSSLEYFAGTNLLAEEDLAYCADLLNTLQEICSAKGVELVMEVGPNKEQVYPEYFPSYTVENTKKRLLQLEEYLHENCSAPFVYPIRELAAHKDEYDTYWKYDTHWNTTGSYIGMKAIYEALGRPISDKDAQMHTAETNLGDLAGITGYTDTYTDYITEYKPNVSVETEVYCDWEYDIDDYGKRYTSTAQNDRKLFVCGDSFRVSLAAHMCKDYKYTDVVHRDIVGLEIPVERLKALTSGDTLVLVCVERWDYYMFGVIPTIIEAMQE